jgi:putative membrane protein
MHKSVYPAACLAAVALLAAGCSTSHDRTYAHETMQQPSTTMAPQSATPQSSTPQSSTAGRTPLDPGTPMAPVTVPQPAARVMPTDAEFANELAASNATEIELARLAYVRAQSPDVRAFARQMLIDHRDMAIRLDNFALERGYLVAWQLDPEKLAVIDRLSTLDSASFDRAYMDEMVAAHTKAVSRLETQAASGRETAAIASESLPKVRHHLEMARELDARL